MTRPTRRFSPLAFIVLILVFALGALPTGMADIAVPVDVPAENSAPRRKRSWFAR